MALLANLTPQIGQSLNRINQNLNNLRSNQFTLAQNKHLSDFFSEGFKELATEFFDLQQHNQQEQTLLDLAQSDAKLQEQLAKLTDDLKTSTALFNLGNQGLDLNLSALNQTFEQQSKLADLNLEQNLAGLDAQKSGLQSQIKLLGNADKQLDLKLQSDLKNINLRQRQEQRELTLSSQLLSNAIEGAGTERGFASLQEIFGEANLARTELSLSDQIAQATADAEAQGANAFTDKKTAVSTQLAFGEAVSRANLEIARAQQTQETIDLQERALKLRSETQQANLIDSIGRLEETKGEIEKSTALQKEANNIRKGALRDRIKNIEGTKDFVKKEHGIRQKLAKIEVNFKRGQLDLKRQELAVNFKGTLTSAKRIAKFAKLNKRLGDISRMLQANFNRNKLTYEREMYMKQAEFKQFNRDLEFNRKMNEIYKARKAQYEELERVAEQQRKISEVNERLESYIGV